MTWELGNGRRGRAVTLAAFAALAIAVTLFLSARLHPESIPPHAFIPSPLGTVDESSRAADASTNSGQDVAILHPKEHSFRGARTWTYHWRVTTGDRRPDGVLKRVYLINGAFPGPTLEVRSGDRLVVHVENGLGESGLSIHWHGLSMRNANHFDGAASVTQAPIEPGQNMVYDFIIDPEQDGTFWYHAHDGVQRADGLYGGLVVHKPKKQQEKSDVGDEHLLLVGDWYHRPAEEALSFYMHPGAFGLETVPDSVVVSGAGFFKCADAVPARPLDCDSNHRGEGPLLRLDAERRNVLRVVNVGAYAGISIAIDGALLTPLSVDGGHSVEGSPSKSVGFLYPGERVDALLKPVLDSSDVVPKLAITLDDSAFKYENPALTPVHDYSLLWKSAPTTTGKQALSPSLERFDLQSAISAQDQSPLVPTQSDQTFVLYTMTQKLAHLDNEPHGFINHSTWVSQTPPLTSVSRDQWDASLLVPLISYQASSPLWVDIVLNNLDEDSHPFHLHGHDFWVIATHTASSSWGSYNPFEDEVPPGGEYDLTHAVKRDTVLVPRRGYVVLRFRADNPGLWMFHCHVLWHQASGMAMAFEVKA